MGAAAAARANQSKAHYPEKGPNAMLTPEVTIRRVAAGMKPAMSQATLRH